MGHVWIKPRNGTFKALKGSHLAPKKFKLEAGVKNFHFGNFSERITTVNHFFLLISGRPKTQKALRCPYQSKGFCMFILWQEIRSQTQHESTRKNA